VPGTAGTKLAYFAAGAVITVVAASALSLLGGLSFFPASADDEERPPIIVRGGSVTFESSEDLTTKPKKWKQVKKDWQPDQKHGIPVASFAVAIDPVTVSCPSSDITHELLVIYTDENNKPSTFLISTRPRDGKKGPPAPAIVTDQELTLDNAANHPTLTYGTAQTGSISEVKFTGIGGPVDCKGPISTITLKQAE